MIKREPVLCAAGFAALVSMLWSPPSAAYFSYIDWRVIALLFCLMAVVAGVEQAGALEKLARTLSSRAKNTRRLCAVLVFLCFFSAMLLTNDVALLTFVPFAALTLLLCKQAALLLPTVILQTVAANLGSMLTPVGNPQNLYLYAHYEMPPGTFFAATLPLTAAGAVVLLLFCRLLPAHTVTVDFDTPFKKTDKRLFFICCVLFLLCLLSVFRVVDWPWALGAVLLAILFFSPSLFKQIDVGLLLTFFFFFIFAGNLGTLAPVRALLQGWMHSFPTETCILLSQVISNVPAAVLLSDFCKDGAALVAGAGIGSFGTLVASLASLISYKIYSRMPGARKGRYLGYFTAVNFAVLFILYMVRFFCLKVL